LSGFFLATAAPQPTQSPSAIKALVKLTLPNITAIAAHL